ncbi:ABC transporter ATP-binding protein [Variovorax sp. N23]|uniref:ABC transporter ATP-binding protein n=1 Tax=Variovorax sp. N23 TaxID=2980555 RepID=UPI0021C66CFA|nr:ABC transporter ATP-binding protein [Variovorax sp. N23]MCU4117992.1 ABC transporter ATP-binding protein [Variovorax sp. N23]
MTNDRSVPVLDVQGLQTHFFTHGGVVKAVDGVDLRVHAGEILGLVGESGSGKSITGFSVIGLIDAPGRVAGGSIRYLGEELVGATEQRLQKLRGKEIAMIFQDPMMTLNPVLRVDTQMVEAIHAHEKVSAKAALARARDALAMVGIPSPEERLQTYPHQLSGGMRQRVAIAIALLNGPKLIIADEPTTALDVTIQAQILYEVQKLCRETGTAMIWITHDLAVVSGLADRIAVMYAGRIVESGATADVIGAPSHPYTRGLIDSIPTRATHGTLLRQIPGMTPSLLHLPQGCAFRPRCSHATDTCLAVPQPEPAPAGKTVRCWHMLTPEMA